MRIKNLSLPFLGFLQATGLLIYIFLIAMFLFNANKMFGPQDGLFSPVAFLLLFVVSALISSSLVLARSLFLFWEKRYKESFTLLSYTILWTVFYLISVFIILFISK